ncbi:MAG: phosphatidate cytidylyltransferase [Betaproteobacteria bacterium]
MTLRLPEPIFSALGLVVVLLAMATVGASVSKTFQQPLRDAEVRLRIRMWWFIVGGFLMALVLDARFSVIALGLVSFVAFKEFLTLAPTRRADSKVLLWAYLAIPIQYFWAGSGLYGMFSVFIPVYVFLLLPMRMVLIGETQGFLRAIGVIHWGLMTTVFCVSHLAFMLALPDLPGLKKTGVNLLFFLVLLTQINDTTHYVANRRFGKHRILLKVRPGLSVEGLVSGTALTTLVAIAIAPLFTPFNWWQAGAAGVMIGLLGFFGFVATAAVERDLGVRESGHFLPGHGGLLERLDSLMFSAPLFFHLVYDQFYR